VTEATDTPVASTVDREGTGVLVWIDAREAVIVRWTGEKASIDRLASDVPAHTRATRHVRYDPLIRHGGGGGQQAAERRRVEHLDRFVQAVADRVDGDKDVVVIGHGMVHEQLDTRLRELDAERHRSRTISVRRADRATERQLVAELRAHLGASPKRRHVGG
jgi:broad specificity phosphatase PhoE